MKKIIVLILIALAIFSCSNNSNVEDIKGKWVRPDGGYILEISEILDDKNLKASYFNPSDIKISVATYEVVKGDIKIHIEFDHKDYRGSKYNLTYDTEKGILSGAYYQATMGQTYNIVFIRQ